MASDRGARLLQSDESRIVAEYNDDLSIPTQSSQWFTGVTKFDNPWSTWVKPGLLKAFEWQVTKKRAAMPDNDELDRVLPVLKPKWNKIQKPPKGEAQVTWMGHASFLIQMDGLNLLTDPVWSDRCSPVPLVGPCRYREPPCELYELPPIDAILISHNHYDHLDLATALHFGDSVLWIVPKALDGWFKQQEISNVVALDWWEKYPLTKSVEAVCLPAQHWSKRTVTDDMQTLWCGWGLIGSKSVYFAGDTGYCSVFKEIGKKYGPFDLGLIPIGAYGPRSMMKCQHVDPKEAVSIHVDIQCKQSIGMHWGTWVLTDEHVFEPPNLLAKELVKRRLNANSFVAIHHGQVFDTSRSWQVETIDILNVKY